MSSTGGTIHEGALTLRGCMWSLMDLYALVSSVSHVGSVVTHVEAPSDHCSNSLHRFVPVGH